MNKNTIALILIGAALVAVIFIYMNKKKNEDDLSRIPREPDAFEIDDTDAYNAVRDMISAIDESQLAWMNDLLKKEHKAGKYKIGGRVSKTATLVEKMTQWNRNNKGKYTDKDGNISLWPQSLIDDAFVNYYLPLKAKYGGI